MVVVGGSNSNNTRELVERCRRANRPVVHVQSAADLDPGWFAGFATVGLTAGTSTLDRTIDEVHRALVRIGWHIRARAGEISEDQAGWLNAAVPQGGASSMSERKRRALGPGGIVLIVLAMIVLGLLATRQNRTVGLGQTIRFDDFDFTALDAAPLPSEPRRPRRRRDRRKSRRIRGPDEGR